MELNEIIYVERLAKCLAHSRWLIISIISIIFMKYELSTNKIVVLGGDKGIRLLPELNF